MGISLKALRKDQRELDIEFPGGTLHVVYQPSAMNARLEDEEATLKESGRPVQGVARSLSKVLQEWNLEDENGRPVPVSYEALAELGMDVLNTITQAILKDLFPNLTSGGRSAAT